MKKELLKINNLTNEYIILTDVFDIYNNKLLNNDNINNLISKNETILIEILSKTNINNKYHFRFRRINIKIRLEIYNYII